MWGKVLKKLNKINWATYTVIKKSNVISKNILEIIKYA